MDLWRVAMLREGTGTGAVTAVEAAVVEGKGEGVGVGVGVRKDVGGEGPWVGAAEAEVEEALEVADLTLDVMGRVAASEVGVVDEEEDEEGVRGFGVKRGVDADSED